jgi:hypothetical protein
MRAAVHVDGAFLVEGADATLDRDELARAADAFLPDRDVRLAAIDVGRHLHAALLFGHRDPRGIPAFRVTPGAIGQRQPRVITKLRPGNAFGEVFPIPRRPGAGQIDLGVCVSAARADQDNETDDGAMHGAATHGTASGSTWSRPAPV